MRAHLHELELLTQPGQPRRRLRIGAGLATQRGVPVLSTQPDLQQALWHRTMCAIGTPP